MPRKRPRSPPPCPNSNCSSDLRKHDKLDGGQRYRCLGCRAFCKPGKTADWVVLSSEVLRGSTIEAIAENLGTDEDTASRMLSAWAQRVAGSRQAGQSIGVGKGWWVVNVGGYIVAVGVQRGEAFRLIGWQGGSGPGLPSTPPVSKPIKKGAPAWVRKILAGAGSDAANEEARLWIALARTNAWPMT